MPELVYSEGVDLPDGRKVRVLAYDDASIRVRLNGCPYAISEAFLQGGENDKAIIKLVPIASGSGAGSGDNPAPTYPCPHAGCEVVAKSVGGLKKHVATFHSLEAHAKLLGIDPDELAS